MSIKLKSQPPKKVFGIVLMLLVVLGLVAACSRSENLAPEKVGDPVVPPSASSGTPVPTSSAPTTTSAAPSTAPVSPSATPSASKSLEEASTETVAPATTKAVTTTKPTQPAPPAETTRKPVTTQPKPAETTKPAPKADDCPSGDYTGSRYDGTCGSKPVSKPAPTTTKPAPQPTNKPGSGGNIGNGGQGPKGPTCVEGYKRTIVLNGVTYHSVCRNGRMVDA